jgi:predicted Fe-Mo cluster-binding NifX family protein
MKIAVSSTDGRTITGHEGMCQDYILIEVNKDQTIRQKHIKLEKSQFLKNLTGQLSNQPDHPLAGIDAFITKNMAENLQSILNKDGIKVLKTNETEPLNVINGLDLTRV